MVKIPKYIEKLLLRRELYATEILVISEKIDEFLEKHGIEVEEYDRTSGVEVYVNPEESANRIRKAIKEK